MGTNTAYRFLYKPSQGAAGLAEKNLFDAGLDRIDARLGKEIWVGDPIITAGVTLKDAIAYCNGLSIPVTLFVPKEAAADAHLIDVNTTINSTVAVHVLAGPDIEIAMGVALTINGSFSAGSYQVFSGSGSVIFGKPVHIQSAWFASPPADPESSLTAPPGSIYTYGVGSPGFYIKDSGTGNTGWISVVKKAAASVDGNVVAWSGASGDALADTGMAMSDIVSSTWGPTELENRLGEEIWVGDPDYGAAPDRTGATDTSSYFDAMLTTIGSDDATLVVPAGTYKLSDDITFPANINLQMLKGAMFSVDTGKTLTVNGAIEAGLYQIFAGAGTVTGAAKVPCVYPEWFGAKGDYGAGNTNDATALNAAGVLARASGCKKVWLSASKTSHLYADAGGYYVTASVDLTGVSVLGRGCLVGNTTVDPVVTVGQGKSLEIDLNCSRSGQAAASQVGILVQNMRFSKGHFDSWGHGVGLHFYATTGEINDYGVYSLGNFRVNKTGLKVSRNDTGYTTELVLQGGEFDENSANVAAADFSGCWNITWHKPSFECDGTGTNGPIFDGCSRINIHNARFETGSGTLPCAEIKNTAHHNTLHFESMYSPGSNYPNYITYSDATYCYGNKLLVGNQAERLLNPNGVQDWNSAYCDGSYDHVPGFGIFDGTAAGRTVGYRKRTAGALTLNDGRVKTTAGYGVGLRTYFNLDPRIVFAVIPGGIPSGYQTALKVRCFNSGGTILTGSSPYYVMASQATWNATYEYYYVPIYQYNYTLPIMLIFHHDVTYADIFIAANGSYAGLNRFELYSQGDCYATTGYTGLQEYPGNLYAANAPTKWHFRVGDIVWNDAAAAGGAPGWVCVKRVDTTINEAGGISASETDWTVTSGSGTANGDIIGLKLDDGTYHFTTIASGGGTTSLVVTAGPPSAAANGNAVVVNLWKAMANLAA